MRVQTIANCEEYAPFLYEGAFITVTEQTETDYCGYYDIGFGTTFGCVPKDLCIVVEE
jgi:hypothetical protein